ncbi:hypothetical protein ACH3XX_00550 [Streptomyces scabiei]|uniref:hypothetical protein n=1 Tax=Streptomyces scabiei TaxID=1930 RepID=UPI00379C56C9
MTEQEQHAEAHRLKTERNFGARRIGQELGISRHAATQLLARPLPQPVAATVSGPAARVAEERPPVAEPVGQEQRVARPVAEPVAELAATEQPVAARVAEVADQRRPVAVGVVVPSGQVAEPVGHVAGVARLFRLPGSRSPWLQVDLAGRPWLLRDLMRLVRLGLQIPHVVDIAVRSFAAAYWEAVTRGHLDPGQPYEVQTRVRPCRHAT